MIISSNDLLRYSKQIILKKIGIVGQKKIAATKVLVIGVGGLGCPLILYLANTGVGNIGLVDNDTVDLSNLNRQIIFNTSDVGKFKVVQAKKILNKINKKIKVKIYRNKLDKKNIQKILRNYDIICDCSDNFTTRYLLNDYSLKNKKILISAAISKFDGHLYKFDFKKKGPCYRCFMPEAPNRENNCESEGIFSPVAGVMGALQANEVLKSILNIKDLTNQVILFDALKTKFKTLKISINKKCLNKC